MPEDALPRPSRDPEHLLRLRDKALARMAQDEALVSPPRVTRRWFTLAAGAAMAAPRAFAGTLRNAAPQYGAPGLPGNPPLLQPKTFATRADLKFIDAWTESRVTLVPPGTVYGSNTKAHTIYYKLGSNRILPLNLISDPASKLTYVSDANAVFYVSDGFDLFGCRFDYQDLVMTPSIAKFRTPPDGDAGAIAYFAANVGDQTLSQGAASGRDIRVSLTSGVPASFWGPDLRGTARNSYPFLYNLDVAGGVLKIGCWISNVAEGTFSIDLKTKKLISFKSN